MATDPSQHLQRCFVRFVLPWVQAEEPWAHVRAEGAAGERGDGAGGGAPDWTLGWRLVVGGLYLLPTRLSVLPLACSSARLFSGIFPAAGDPVTLFTHYGKSGVLSNATGLVVSPVSCSTASWSSAWDVSGVALDLLWCELGVHELPHSFGGAGLALETRETSPGQEAGGGCNLCVDQDSPTFHEGKEQMKEKKENDGGVSVRRGSTPLRFREGALGPLSVPQRAGAWLWGGPKGSLGETGSGLARRPTRVTGATSAGSDWLSLPSGNKEH